MPSQQLEGSVRVGGAFKNGGIIPPSRLNPTRGLDDKDGLKDAYLLQIPAH